ncbi:molecular chaperone DnaJ [Marinobacter fuscus]|uniref:Molecular chaperone DnaJ n=1 Tax=Marinobacter fuscus TaxID=2109942 RepID=A0A2T1KPV7_9GAMM|nr:J domain-containing protein [Marinobacter fuscus]PSF12167.1 molecular chaperone DnaJ [Marinobacter fuscus]
MTCWDLLGIEPTGDLDQIRRAYDRQMKFASGDEARALEQAFREATGSAPQPQSTPAPEALAQAPAADDTADGDTLSAEEAQIAREVVIQIHALMNDSGRQQDVGIWKAILCEPPADRPAVRREIASQLEPQIRPLAENGAFPGPVVRFLGDWFEWFNLKDVAPEVDPRSYPETDDSMVRQEQAADAQEPPQMANFWPAVIGWIVGLVILATIFGGMGGG